jgi:RimJ/RimL family protein N-acetyltransferase
MQISIEIGNKNHERYACLISKMILVAAQKKRTTIALRDPKYILDKIKKSKTVIAMDGKIVVGFCYFQNWENDEYIAHSGLIINENYRGKGLSRKIKKEIFDFLDKPFQKQKFLDSLHQKL